MGTVFPLQEGLKGPVKWLVATGLFAGLLVLCGSPAEGKMAGFFQIETGVVGREVVEEDPSLSDFKFHGDAVSTRLTAKAGVIFREIFTAYAMGGGADLSIEEFSDYSGDLSGLLGGGIRVNLYRSPYPDRTTLFVEGQALRFTTDDRVQIEMGCTAARGCAADSGIFLPRMADEEIEWNEYTLMIGGGAHYPGFAPYGGVRFSVVDGEDRIKADPDSNFSVGFKVSPDLEQEDIFGLFFGLDIFFDPSENTALNFEISLIDQDSFRAAIRRTF